MTISLARRQRLAAVAKAHDAWVEQNSDALADVFDPSAYPKPGSDYNQHVLDVDAPGEIEDEFAAMVAAGGFMTAAGDPDWDPKEHPRGPDGKFIESGALSFGPATKMTAANIKVGQYVGANPTAHVEQYWSKDPKRVVSVVKAGKYYEITREGEKYQLFSPHEKIAVYEPKESKDLDTEIKLLENEMAANQFAKNIAYMKDEPYKVQELSETLLKQQKQMDKLKAAKAKAPAKQETSSKAGPSSLVSPSTLLPGQIIALDATADSPPEWSNRSPVTDVTELSGGLFMVHREDGSVLTLFSDNKVRLFEDVNAPQQPLGKPLAGKPITAWTKTIYSGKYGDGDIVAVKDDGSERLSWDEGSKKFVWDKKIPTGWTMIGLLNKKDAYANFKGEKKSWLAPVGANLTDFAPPPSPEMWTSSEKVQPVSTLPAASPVAAGDFSGLKKVGAQGGSNPGGVYEAPDGTRWYVKSQKSAMHAKNEALAAAFYRLAGIDVPEVVQGSGTPGLFGSSHTASRMVDGASMPFPNALSDKTALAEMRKGFALDAWLANWDVAGLSYDNVVKGSDGKFYRIDVGGSLLFRAMGGEKGIAFGDEVKEFESLRDDTNFVSKSIFGGMSAEEIAASAKKVAEISPDQIRKLVADYGMDSSLADRLVARREDLLARAKAKASMKVTSPDFTILPKDQRGKSGDGYFAPKIWGKYGAAGVMMRNVDKDGVERFLLVKANTQNHQKWQLPGGALEELETPEQGAAREVHEELGFTQDFLHNMTPIGTHKVSVNVPDKGTWNYSNIAVDVPSMPDLKWDSNELGGAKWFTAEELSQMSANNQIHSALTANLPQVLAKFDNAPAAAPEPAAPDVAPVTPAIPSSAPKISSTSSGKTTVWSKAKFTQALAYKQKYADSEIIGIADIGLNPKRIVWSNGKFHSQGFLLGANVWVPDKTWPTKKAALAELQGVAFYRPPAGTMSNTNTDFLPAGDVQSGQNSIAITESVDVLQQLMDNVPMATGIAGLSIKPFNEDGKPFAGFKTSYVVSNADGDKLGAIHEDGNAWMVAPKGIYKPHQTQFYGATQEDALKVLAEAESLYKKAQLSQAAIPAPKTSPVTKKKPKLTAAQIEKQNGTIPKTLKGVQKEAFVKEFKQLSPVMMIYAHQLDMPQVFPALVKAVKNHNATQSPKLNYLQAINLFDQMHGTKKKNDLVAWLQTSEGKTLAPTMVADDFAGAFIPGSVPSGVPSAYSMGTPKKVASSAFKERSLTEMLEMHYEMYANNPMLPSQLYEIREYQGNSDDFNYALRKEPGNTLTSYKLNKIKTLQEAMRPTTKSLIVYRGTDGIGSALNKNTISSLSDLKKFEGAIVADPAFLSTSFAQDAAFSSRKFKLIISVPEGTPGTLTYAASEGYKSEKEFTLAAGLQFRIDRTEEVGAGLYSNYFNIYMTVVPEMKK